MVLELAWEGAAFSVKSQHSLRSQPFPSLHVERLTEDDLVAGERTLIAVASVTVDGQPYPVSPSSISWELSGVTESGEVELVPGEVSSTGEGWVFDVFATLDEPVHSALTLSLEIEYAGSPPRRHGRLPRTKRARPAGARSPAARGCRGGATGGDDRRLAGGSPGGPWPSRPWPLRHWPGWGPDGSPQARQSAICMTTIASDSSTFLPSGAGR